MTNPPHVRRMKRAALVVDDDAGVREVVCEIISPVADCVAAETYRQAKAQLEGILFDVAILDLRLADDNSGWDIVSLIRRASLPTPIVLISGSMDTSVLLQAVGNHLFAVVPKPFTPQELMAVVTRAFLEFDQRRERLNKEDLIKQFLAAGEFLEAHSSELAALRGIYRAIRNLNVEGGVRQLQIVKKPGAVGNGDDPPDSE